MKYYIKNEPNFIYKMLLTMVVRFHSKIGIFGRELRGSEIVEFV